MTREVETLSRREMLRRSVALSALVSARMALPDWMPRLAFSNRQNRGDVLVAIFLRGGADGLNIVVPYTEDAYYQARPVIGLARPDDSQADKAKKVLDLDGKFGIHPALEPLLPIFKSKQLTVVHATGSPDPTRSHFDAMGFMERATPGDKTLNSGWLGRHLSSIDPDSKNPLRGIGWGNSLQASLRGTLNATAIKSIIDYHLAGRKEAAADMLEALNALYTVEPATLKSMADQTNAVFNLLAKLNVAAYKPGSDAQYDMKNDYHLGLMQTAALIKADVGLEVAAIDLGGWDTHQNEVNDIAKELTQLGSGLAAFYKDMGPQAMQNVTVVVMSEFGRRVQENASAGTDHGHGNLMFVMGGSVAQKPVVTDWPGLAPDKLDNGDLKITIDYRDVLAEILTNRLNNTALDKVFPGYKPTARGVVTK